MSKFAIIAFGTTTRDLRTYGGRLIPEGSPVLFDQGVQMVDQARSVLIWDGEGWRAYYTDSVKFLGTTSVKNVRGL